MAGYKWWTDERLGWLRDHAAMGLSARDVAALENGKWPRDPPVTARGVRLVCQRVGIKLLARGGGRGGVKHQG